jgi:hypothetical protein
MSLKGRAKKEDRKITRLVSDMMIKAYINAIDIFFKGKNSVGF